MKGVTGVGDHGHVQPEQHVQREQVGRASGSSGESIFRAEARGSMLTAVPPHIQTMLMSDDEMLDTIALMLEEDDALGGPPEPSNTSRALALRVMVNASRPDQGSGNGVDPMEVDKALGSSAGVLLTDQGSGNGVDPMEVDKALGSSAGVLLTVQKKHQQRFEAHVTDLLKNHFENLVVSRDAKSVSSIQKRLLDECESFDELNTAFSREFPQLDDGLTAKNLAAVITAQYLAKRIIHLENMQASLLEEFGVTSSEFASQLNKLKKGNDPTRSGGKGYVASYSISATGFSKLIVSGQHASMRLSHAIAGVFGWKISDFEAIGWNLTDDVGDKRKSDKPVSKLLIASGYFWAESQGLHDTNAALQARGLNGERLSEKDGAFRSILRGKQDFTPAQMKELARAYGVEEEKLAGALKEGKQSGNA